MGQAPPSKAQRIHFKGRNCDGIDSKFKQLRYEIFRCKTSRRVKGRLPSAPLRSPAHNVGDHASAKRGRIGAGRVVAKETRIGSIARSSPSFCGFRCCRGNGTRTRRDGWRGRLQTPSNNV